MTNITGLSLPQPILDDPRGVSVELHSHLRRLINDGVIPAGAVLKQAELAREFGVSRTPMREAFRMLQEEGLIDAEQNQRAQVRDLHPQELDQLYGVRITLESLGARITAGNLAETEIESAYHDLGAMHSAQARGDSESWRRAHRSFHGACVSRADDPLRRVITSCAARSERYIRLDQVLHPDSFAIAQDEHRGMLDAVIAGDAELAGRRVASHLARTAMYVLRDEFPGTDAIAVRNAITMTGATIPQPRD